MITNKEGLPISLNIRDLVGSESTRKKTVLAFYSSEFLLHDGWYVLEVGMFVYVSFQRTSHLQTPTSEINNKLAATGGGL